MNPNSDKNKFANQNICMSDELQNFHDIISSIIKKKTISADYEIDRQIREYAIASMKQMQKSDKFPAKKIFLKEILYYTSAAAAAIAILSVIIFIAPHYHKPSKENNNADNIQNVSATFVNVDRIDWTSSSDANLEVEALYEEITYIGNGYNLMENNQDDEIESLLLTLQTI